ncbi:hypothetical protein [Prevotella conceptionensis]|uniref:hypothetical protein n=1 Tax=Prevotella conceptionensis TaxID=340486 RepID=UPI0002E85863|nr:hypothetical protein [Prevotella conceptionensis]
MSTVSVEKWRGETEEDVVKSSSEHENNKQNIEIIKQAYFTFILIITCFKQIYCRRNGKKSA